MNKPVADVFLTISAQEDNLGDIEIRQQMINMVSHPAVRLHISRGNMSDSYVEAFDFPPNSVVYESKHQQALELIRSIVRGRASVVFPPGPYPATSTRSAVRAFGSLMVTLAARATGGASITVGKSVRGHHTLAIAAERQLSTRSNMYVARDRKTAEVLGVPVESAPDIAMLSHYEPSNGMRSKLAVSLRHDGSDGDELLRALTAWAEPRHLEIVLVSQVRRDDGHHRALATRHGVSLVEWGGQSHRAQMERVQSIYAGSALVVTDRLHAALFGAVAGAIPVALTYAGRPSKIRDAFHAVLPQFEIDGESPDAKVLDLATQSRGKFEMEFRRSHYQLVELRDEVMKTIIPPVADMVRSRGREQTLHSNDPRSSF